MIKKIDHVVITTVNIENCFHFYEKLGFHPKNEQGRYMLFADSFKINVHLKGKELSPHASHVQEGSADLCFEIDENIEGFKDTLVQKGITVELGIVNRTGARGVMRSLYLRDPDGNLVELCSYDK